jgi:hypothetical protein
VLVAVERSADDRRRGGCANERYDAEKAADSPHVQKGRHPLDAHYA